MKLYVVCGLTINTNNMATIITKEQVEERISELENKYAEQFKREANPKKLSQLWEEIKELRQLLS
jgi:hypothetical protein